MTYTNIKKRKYDYYIDKYYYYIGNAKQNILMCHKAQGKQIKQNNISIQINLDKSIGINISFGLYSMQTIFFVYIIVQYYWSVTLFSSSYRAFLLLV